MPLSSVLAPVTELPTLIIVGTSADVGPFAAQSQSDGGWFVVVAHLRELHGMKAGFQAQRAPRLAARTQAARLVETPDAVRGTRKRKD
jgi:hypothetical protein